MVTSMKTSTFKRILEGESVMSVLSEGLVYSPKEVFAEYTGGGVWLFHGPTKSGEWFLTDDFGATLILDEDPSDFDQSLYPEWQKEHLIAEPSGTYRLKFGNEVIDYLLSHTDNAHRGGILADDLEEYRKKFEELN